MLCGAMRAPEEEGDVYGPMAGHNDRRWWNLEGRTRGLLAGGRGRSKVGKPASASVLRAAEIPLSLCRQRALSPRAAKCDNGCEAAAADLDAHPLIRKWPRERADAQVPPSPSPRSSAFLSSSPCRGPTATGMSRD